MAIALSAVSPITRAYLFPVTNSSQNFTFGSYNLTLSHSAIADKTILISSSNVRRPVSAAAASSSTGKFYSLRRIFHILITMNFLICMNLAAGTSQSSIGISEETGTLLERVKVFDLNGKSMMISDLWKDRKAVVAFARHFGYAFHLIEFRVL